MKLTKKKKKKTTLSDIKVNRIFLLHISSDKETKYIQM